MKKIVTLILCIAMMMSMTVAIADVTPAGEYPLTTQVETLTIAMPVSSKVEDLDTNQLTLWLEEKLGIQIEFVQLSTSDTDTQVNMMMTSGDLPDLVLGYNFPYDMLCNYADAGLLMDIGELLEQYASEEGYKNFKNTFTVDNIEAYVSYDGGMYAMPSGGAMYTNMYGGYAGRIQGSFLEALGMELPRTLEEYYNYLVAVRDGDPNGNGDTTDEIPLTSATIGDQHLSIIRIIGNAFQYTEPDNYMNLMDGKVSFIANNDLYKETVEYLKKLVDEKLLDPAAFTQDEATLLSRQTENDNIIGSIMVGANISECMDTNAAPYLTMQALPALEGPYGYKTTAFMTPKVRRSGVVTTACKNPALAVRFLDFLLTEECSVAFRLGFEGSEWEKAEEGINGRNGEPAKYTLLKPQEWIQPSTNVIWNMESSNYCQVMNYVYDGPNSTTGRVGRVIVAAGLPNDVKNEYLPELLISAGDSPEYIELKDMITNYVNTNTLLFALGDRSLSEWNDYCAELDAMGVARYLEMTQDAYDAMIE